MPVLEHFKTTRRAARQVGMGLFGLNLPAILCVSERSHSVGRTSCIFLFLAGGSSHFETFDPKPDAPSEIRGRRGHRG